MNGFVSVKILRKILQVLVCLLCSGIASCANIKSGKIRAWWKKGTETPTPDTALPPDPGVAVDLLLGEPVEETDNSP